MVASNKGTECASVFKNYESLLCTYSVLARPYSYTVVDSFIGYCSPVSRRPGWADLSSCIAICPSQQTHHPIMTSLLRQNGVSLA